MRESMFSNKLTQIVKPKKLTRRSFSENNFSNSHVFNRQPIRARTFWNNYEYNEKDQKKFGNDARGNKFNFLALNKADAINSALIWSLCLLFSVNVAAFFSKREENTQKVTQKEDLSINVKSYFYHRISGFNLFELISILNNGILSEKDEIEELKEDILKVLHKADFVLNVEAYDDMEKSQERIMLKIAGGDSDRESMSVIVDPSNFWVSNFLDNVYSYNNYYPSFDEIPFYKRTIAGKVSPEEIVGVIVPQSYLTENLTNLHIFDSKCIYDKELLKSNMDNLNLFMQKQFGCSIFSNVAINKSYEKAMKEPDFSKGLFKIERDFQEAYDNLSCSVMKLIKSEYEKKLSKSDITAIDILHDVTQNKCRFYTPSGQFIVPLAENSLQSTLKSFSP